MDKASSDNRSVELTPAQPDEVVRAVEALARDRSADVDPWWQAGLDESLDVPVT
jgi:hypothetical protein